MIHRKWRSVRARRAAFLLWAALGTLGTGIVAQQYGKSAPALAFVAALLLASAISGNAQAPCAGPAATLKPKGPTIFSPEQEGYLGEIVAQQLSLGMIVYPQAELTAPLDRIAARLLKYLPENPYRFQFSLVESSDANAFALPAGWFVLSCCGGCRSRTMGL